MEFTFLMDANSSKYFYNYFMGMKHDRLLKSDNITYLEMSYVLAASALYNGVFSSNATCLKSLSLKLHNPKPINARK